jgi:hypothetical protein
MRRHVFLRLALAAALVAGAAHATLVERLSLEQMVERSERIVEGRCLRAWSAWDASHQFIWTHSEIAVSDPLKGGAVRTVVVSEPGGVVDGIGMRIEGMPHYEPGEEMIVFLYRAPGGYWRARGLAQGKFGIRVDPRSGERRVRADLQSAALAGDPSAEPGVRGVDLRRLDGLTVEAFKSRVRALASRGGNTR